MSASDMRYAYNQPDEVTLCVEQNPLLRDSSAGYHTGHFDQPSSRSTFPPSLSSITPFSLGLLLFLSFLVGSAFHSYYGPAAISVLSATLDVLPQSAAVSHFASPSLSCSLQQLQSLSTRPQPRSLHSSSLRSLPSSSEQPSNFSAPADHSEPVTALQAWVLAMLQPFKPRLLPAVSDHEPVQDGGELIYRHGGLNYEVGSSSSRLQRLPRLAHRLNFTKEYGYRFPSNPALVAHPILRSDPCAGLYHYQLSIQLGTYGTTRSEGGTVGYNHYHYRLGVLHVGLTLTINVSSSVVDPLQPNFQLSYQHEQVLTDAAQIDQKLVAYNIAVNETSTCLGNGTSNSNNSDTGPASLLLAYDNAQTVSLLRVVRTGNATLPVRYEHYVKQQPLVYTEPEVRQQKNFMALVLGNGTVYWVSRFSPFTVLDCGPPLRPQPCELFRYRSLSNTFADRENAVRWRGNSAFIPLPAFPHLFLGVIHQRYGSGRNHYNHRLILVDSVDLEPIGYTDPFGFFAFWDDADWFEFVISIQLLQRPVIAEGELGGWRAPKQSSVYELLFSLGYNDQEPWLAVLPLEGFIRHFKPIEARSAAQVEQVKLHYLGNSEPEAES